MSVGQIVALLVGGCAVLYLVNRAARKIFHALVQPKGGDSSTSLYILAITALTVALAVMVFGYLNFEKIENLGTFGDFVGGTINPFLTFLTFLGLIATIIIQQKANSAASEAATKAEIALADQIASQKRQSFENTLFAMLELHNTIVTQMDVHRKTMETLYGRDCFKHMTTQLQNHWKEASPKRPVNNPARINAAYKQFYEKWRKDLGHYFRYLYNLIRFIDNAGVSPRYMKLVRAQLSDYELVILFYNCLTPAGFKFKHYAEKYTLFDNLDSAILFSKTHRNGLFDELAFDESHRPIKVDDKGNVIPTSP
ncbi:putative phage abortive infection protein [Mesorhizobium sp. W016]